MITIEKLYDDVIIPSRQSTLAIGYDAHAYVRDRIIASYSPDNVRNEHTVPNGYYTIPAGYRALIPLGFKAQLPEGIEAQVRSRSGLALKQALIVFNQPGTIDPDYSGEWAVMLVNDSTRAYGIQHGDRIAQIVLNRVVFVPWFPGEVTGDRQGFGSTGVAA